MKGKSSLTEMFPLALIEPTTSVLLYPLIADLHSRFPLVFACQTSYVTFFFILKICVTSSSLFLVSHSIKQTMHLINGSEKDKTEKFNKLYLIAIVCNSFYSYIVLSFGLDNKDFEGPTMEECFPVAKDDRVLLTGIKAFVPQAVTLVLMIGIFLVILMQKPTADLSKRLPAESSSPKMYLWSVTAPVIVALIFQMFYFGLRFVFVFCSCGWFKLVSKSLDLLNWTCFLKSLVFSVVVFFRYNHS